MALVLPAFSRLITAAALVVGLSSHAAPAAQATPDAATTAARAALKAAPAAGTSGSGFVANHGQWEAEVLFMAPIQGGRAWVTAKGIVYDFTKAAKRPPRDDARKGTPKDGPKAAKARQAQRVQGHVVRLDFAGAMQPAVRSSGKLKTRVNYFIGNDASKHARNVPAYTAVSLDGLWPGVGLRLEQRLGGLGLAFNAADAAALAKARVFVDGAALLEGRGEGAVVATSIGQRSLGAVAVTLGAARYAGKLAGGAVALAPGRAEAQAQTTAVAENSGGLVYSTFLGGGIDEVGWALAVDASGAAYVTGYTASSNFPTTPGAYDRTFSPYNDAFVTKLSADGSALVYATFLGGPGNYDAGTALAVDASGAAYLAGETEAISFPTTRGAFDTTHGGGFSDAFVTKLSADGSALVYSTFLGGSDYDSGKALAVDASGAAYVTGETRSMNFPTTPGAFDRIYNGGDAYGGDVFVTKLSADGSALVYSTFLGGDYDDNGKALAVDISGAAYVAGQTSSEDFPTTPWAFDTTYNDDPGGRYVEDAFVTKLSADGSALVYSTFLGGSAYDLGKGLAVDASGAAYVTGDTVSPEFPTTLGAFDTIHNGGGGGGYVEDAFVTKLSADGSALVYSTFLGGYENDWSNALALDASGAAYVTGETYSADFPTTPGAFDTTYNGDDAFVTKLSADGSALIYSTFLGGANYDYGLALALDANGAAYVTGQTWSSDFPITPGAFDTSYNGGYADAFITKLDIGTPTGIDLIATATPTTVAAGGSFTVNYTVNNHDGAAVTGDLFFTATDSGGNRVGKGQFLADTTVAAHGAITGSYSQLVPSNAAPGVYTYTLRAGKYPGTTRDEQAFTITVTAPAQAGGAAAWQAVKRR